AFGPFGLPLSATETVPNPFEYVGQLGVMEDANGLSFMRARYYDRSTGRFLTPDPIGIAGGINLYAYCQNDPIGSVDPEGFGPIVSAIKSLLFTPAKVAKGLERGGMKPEETGRLVATGLRNAFNPAGRVEEATGHLFPTPTPPAAATAFGGSGVAGAVDPNQKLGPAGFGTPRYVQADSVLAYRADFENEPSATAPAQQVAITDSLDSDLDWTTFELTEIGFGDHLIAVPNDTQHYETRVPMTYNGVDFEVWIDAGIQAATGQVYANFYSIDPATSLPPSVLIGFLPPEDGTGRGQGHVSYTVKPQSGVAEGTEIRNVALISFDSQASIATNQVDAHDPSQGTDPDKECLNTLTFDNTGPRVTDMTPAPSSSQTDVSSIVLTFNEDLAESTVHVGGVSTTVKLSSDKGPDLQWGTEDDTYVAGTVAYDAGLDTVTFTPSSALAGGEYAVWLDGTASIRDLVGNVLDGEYIGKFPSGDGTPGGDFTAVFTLDTEPPQVTAMTPNPGSTVGSLWQIEVTFSEEMDAESVNSSTFKVSSDPGDDETWGTSDDVDVAGTIYYQPYDFKATFTPDSELPDGDYALWGDGTGSITDLAGNRLDGEFAGGFPSGNGAAGGDFVATFTVGDTAPAGWTELGHRSAREGGISNDAGISDMPTIVAGSSVNPIVAWHDNTVGNHEIYVRQWNGAAWVEMGAGSASGGGISNNSGDSYAPAAVLGQDGNPIVAWADATSYGYDSEIYVKRWDGDSWEEMGAGSASGGGISNTFADSGWPSIILGSDGHPIVAWFDFASGDHEIYVRRWNGASWVEMGLNSATGGGVSDNTGSSQDPDMLLGSDGNPLIAWHDDTGGNWDIYVRRWDGDSWEEVGAGSASGGGVSNTDGFSWSPALTLAQDNSPVIAWQDDDSGDDEIYVRRWDGASWVEMGLNSATGGGISDNADPSECPALARGADGHPIVTWYDADTAYTDTEVYVKRWNGTAWVEMDAGSASGGGISDNDNASEFPVITTGSGNPIVAWQDETGAQREIFVRQYSLAPSGAPSAVDLLPASDTGSSSADDLTNLDNSTPGSVLQFHVSGTIAGATVTLYDGAMAIGSAIASGASTVVTTNGAYDLADGLHALTARQTEPGKSESPDSTS
ncbi:MAG: hypothetical protein FJ272_04945, partial [Planctomycetes bacterium]|nr:hypothetical protein [Planctomycetota bacterium]